MIILTSNPNKENTGRNRDDAEGRQCRDVPAGASDMSTGRRMHLQRTDATEPPRTASLHTVF